MLGTIVNVITILIGSIVGGTLKKFLSQRITDSLFAAMGLAAFILGINAAVQNMPNSTYPVLFIASLAIGGAVGTALKLDERMQKLTSKKGNGKLGEGLITGCLLYCIGTLSILGPIQAALYGDYTFLFTNAMLDLVTSAVLASTYGIGMALAAPVLLCWQGAIFLSTLMLGDFITGTMMCELSIVGGCLIMMSGMGILGVKDFKTLNFLPALVVPIIWCLIVAQFGI